ncbi:DUF6584 family protein [Streptomyces sp. NPDC058542]|uniref:DUF6584 family protein n=1 Tax=Streptomyces sp. NPDC058542 TaxID=3346543 RepID=UPI00364F13B6
MPLNVTLARVDADLAAGRIPVARQRLRGLVSSHPHEPEPRRRLAAVHRLYGDTAEAGRWMYLEEDRVPEETAAFEKRYATHLRRMTAVAWRDPESPEGVPAFAARQLTALRTAASDEVGCPLDWDGLPAGRRKPGPREDGTTTVGERAAAVGCAVAVIAFLAIWVNGLIDLLD